MAKRGKQSGYVMDNQLHNRLYHAPFFLAGYPVVQGLSYRTEHSTPFTHTMHPIVDLTHQGRITLYL